MQVQDWQVQDWQACTWIFTDDSTNLHKVHKTLYQKDNLDQIPGHFTSMKYELGDCTSLFNLCFLFSSSAVG